MPNVPFYLNHKETGVQVKNKWKLTGNIKEYALNMFRVEIVNSWISPLNDAIIEKRT
jgi:hypothetical protein